VGADEGAQNRIARPVAVIVLGFIGGLVAVCLGSCLFGSVLSVGTRQMTPDEIRNSSNTLFIALIAVHFSMLAAVRYGPEKLDDLDGGDWKQRARWRLTSFNLFNTLCIAAGALACGGLVLKLLPSPASTDALQTLARAARTTDDLPLGVLILLIAVLPGVSEELSFRGILQPRLVERFGPAIGIVATSLLFGLIHFDLRQGLAAFAIGLWLGWCSWRENSTVNVAFGHIINNAAFVLANHFASAGAVYRPIASVRFAVLTVCIAAMYWRTRKVKT